jgi:hypothetical protein
MIISKKHVNESLTTTTYTTKATIAFVDKNDVSSITVKPYYTATRI